MPFFTKSRKPSNQVKIIKAVNGGSRGHQERNRKKQKQPQPPQQRLLLSQNACQFDGFWDAIDEREFAQQDARTSPNLMLSNSDRSSLMGKIDSFRRRKRQYSSETPETRSRQSSNEREAPPQRDFWRKPTEQEEAELLAASTEKAHWIDRLLGTSHRPAYRT